MKKLLLWPIVLLLFTARSGPAQTCLVQNTSIKVRIGTFVDVGDGVTPETDVTIAGSDEAEILKANGAATVAMTGTFAAVSGSDGTYDYTLQTTDVDTLGELRITMQDDDHYLPVWEKFEVKTVCNGVKVAAMDDDVITNGTTSNDADTEIIGLVDSSLESHGIVAHLGVWQTQVATDNGSGDYDLQDGPTSDDGWVADQLVAFRDAGDPSNIAFTTISTYTASGHNITTGTPAFDVDAGDAVFVFANLSGSGTGATAAEVWGYVSRTLTALDEDDTTIDLDASAVGSVTGAVGSVTGAVGSVTGAVGSVTGNVGGNVVGSVGSVTGAVGSVTGNVGGISGTLNQLDDLENLSQAGAQTAAELAIDARNLVDLATTIAGRTSNSVFTLTVGAPDNTSYVNQWATIIDQADPTQKMACFIRSYTTATNEITCAADPGVFTSAIGDIVIIHPRR